MAKVYTQLKNMDACENYQVKSSFELKDTKNIIQIKAKFNFSAKRVRNKNGKLQFSAIVAISLPLTFVQLCWQTFLISKIDTF